MKTNLDAFTISEILINEDSTQGDYYSLRGMAYFQRAKLLDDSKEIIEKSKQDLIRAKRKITGGLDRMRNINKIKLTSMENLK